VNFRARKEEYVTCWFSSSLNDLDRRDLRPEISGFGAAALSLSRDEKGQWFTNLRLPPGLKPGRHPVRLRTSESEFSNECFIFVDTPVVPDAIEILSFCDGISWRENVCVAANGRFGALYVERIAENSDRNNLEVMVQDTVLKPTFVGATTKDGWRQVNLQFPQELALGKYEVKVRQAGEQSNTVIVDLIP